MVPGAALSVLLAIALSATPASADLSDANALVPRGPIRILAAADFTAANGVRSGNGTAADPFVISDWSIVASTASGIVLTGTSAHVVVRNVAVQGGGGSFDGIALSSAANVTVENARSVNQRYGILVAGGANVTVRNNTVTGSAVGIRLASAVGAATVVDNLVANNGIDVEFSASRGNTLLRNDLAIVPGATGLSFDTEASWENRIDATNTVNRVPVRWHVGETGVRIDGSAGGGLLDVSRITNVAHVVLHNVTDAVVANLTVAGAETGVLVSGSSGVRLENLTVRDSTFDAVRVAGGANVTLASVATSKSGVGVRSVATTDLRVEGGAHTLASRGVRLEGATRATVRNATFDANAVHVYVQAGSGTVLSGIRGANST
ncbi:MAG: NosD domain-containing protein, partial [Methanobacteriota archaeon]